MTDILTGLEDQTHVTRVKSIEALEAQLPTADDAWIGTLENGVLELAKTCPRWEGRHGALLAAVHLCKREGAHDLRSLLLKEMNTLLEDEESRVRNATADLLFVLAHHEGTQVWHEVKDVIIRNIQDNYERNTGEPGSELPTPSDPNLSPRMAGKQTNLMHDTEGWKTLETSMRALQQVIAGTGDQFSEHIDEKLLSIVSQAIQHTNRFVRESGYYTLGSVSGVCKGEEFERLGPSLSKQLSTGLSDNWSQVRYAASNATRTFLLKNMDSKHKFYDDLVPPMCLNRYYVAEGVRLYSQQTWAQVCGQEGRSIVAQCIDKVVDYYTLQANADNHAVREAACHCIAELAVKIDHERVRPHVSKLLTALLDCFKDESWPVRDAACEACGNFVGAFAEEAKSYMDELWELWFAHISDNIPSVRECSAIALGKVMKSFGDEAVQKVVAFLKDNLAMAKEQKDHSHAHGNLSNETQFGVAKQMRDNDVALHTGQTMYSCGSLAPKLKRGGGCMDHGFKRDKEPWETSDGCVHLVRELSVVNAAEGEKFLPTIAEIANLSHFAHSANLMETIWKQAPAIAKALGKRPFKRYLEELLPPLLKALECGNNLAMSAAGEAAENIAAFIGPNIFMGRLTDNQRDKIERSEHVRIAPM